MLGKNKGKPRPTKRKKHLPWEAVLVPCSTENVAAGQESISIVPKRVGSDWSFIQLADEIEPVALAEILEFSAVRKGATVPLQACVAFHTNYAGLLEPLATDAAYLHAAALGTHIYIGLMFDRPDFVEGTSPHYPKALRLLRERLASTEESEKTSDSTIIVVVALALHARTRREYVTARHHIQGILKMAELRGSITGIHDRAMLAMEVFRCDISIALETGSKPVFFAETSSGGSFMPFPEQISTFKSEIGRHAELDNRSNKFLEDIDEELAIVWTAMERLCSVINRAARLKQRFPEAILLQAMASLMYRLLHSSFASESLEEPLRLGLLAFCSHAFLQLPSLRIHDTALPGAYQECLLNVALSARLPPPLLLWLQMVGAVSIFGIKDQVWLKPLVQSSIEICGIESWSDLADLMNSFVWIDLLFDGRGKEVFESMALQ